MGNTEKIKLDYPVKVKGVDVEELQMRRPKVRDQLAADKLGGTDAEKEIRIFANLTEQANDVIEDLDMADYGKLQGVYKGFLSLTPKKPEENA